MNEAVCERVCLAMMALADGQTSSIPESEINAHLAVCAGCREEREQMMDLCAVLGRHQRKRPSDQLWFPIAQRLRSEAVALPPQRGWRIIAPLGLLIVAHRVLDLSSSKDMGFLYAALPVLVAMALFVGLRENPFRIDTTIRLEGGH